MDACVIDRIPVRWMEGGAVLTDVAVRVGCAVVEAVIGRWIGRSGQRVKSSSVDIGLPRAVEMWVCGLECITPCTRADAWPTDNGQHGCEESQ